MTDPLSRARDEAEALPSHHRMLFRGSHGWVCVEDATGNYATMGAGHRLCCELAAELDRYKQALDSIRDSVLHERHQLAEEGLTSDQVNAVLGIIDDQLQALQEPPR